MANYWTPKQDDVDDILAEDFNNAFKQIEEDITMLQDNGKDGTTDHSQLTNLGFEESEHTGFQRELTAEQLANIAAVPDISEKVDKTAEKLTEQADNTYTKTEVNELISRIPKMSFEVWGGTPEELLALPEEEISDTTIYLVSKESGTHNIYAEYIYINGVWEKLGDLDIDLTGYATKEEVEAMTPTAITDPAGALPLTHNTQIETTATIGAVSSDSYGILIGSIEETPVPDIFESVWHIQPCEEAFIVGIGSGMTILFFGDDCDETGVFTPQANTHYEIHFKRMGSDDSSNPLIIARVGAWQ